MEVVGVGISSFDGRRKKSMKEFAEQKDAIEDDGFGKLRVSNSECNGEFEILDFSCSDDSDSSTEHEEESSTERGPNSRREEERAIFQKARQYLNPGCFFRLIVYLYAERKLIVFFWIHFFSTLVVWGKFISINTNDS
jgi:hypothetical protein